MATETIIEKELDTEWLGLILEALSLGISGEEIRDFLKQTPKP